MFSSNITLQYITLQYFYICYYITELYKLFYSCYHFYLFYILYKEVEPFTVMDIGYVLHRLWTQKGHGCQTCVNH